jgi:ferric-dicitrate binding protein FerR (iron transport regulator)
MTDYPERSEADVERALSGVMRAGSLDPEALARMRGAVGQEWQNSVDVDRRSRLARRRRKRWVAIAAAAGLAAVTIAWLVGSLASPVVFGSIARLNGPDSDVRFMIVRHHTPRVGEALRTGETLTTHGPALVSLAAGGTLRVAAASVIEIRSGTEIRLTQGMIYVDKAPTPRRSDHLRVATAVGTLEHLGTQFEVLGSQQSVRVRVREGKVRLHGASAEVVAGAGTELLATPGGEVSRRPVATYGPDWQWVAALAPDFVIEDQSLLSFLEWVSRELGRHLEFATPKVRDIATRTILHGTVQGREPLEALADVLATTSLSYEIRGDTILVQAGS